MIVEGLYKSQSSKRVMSSGCRLIDGNGDIRSLKEMGFDVESPIKFWFKKKN